MKEARLPALSIGSGGVVTAVRRIVFALALAILFMPFTAHAPSPAVAGFAPPLATTEFGKGPTLVLVPGLGSQRMEWMPTARRLVSSYRVVMVDLPGHGESLMPDPFSFEASAAMLDQVLAAHNPDSTIVVAHGVGGLIAVLEARAHPDRMRGLVAIDASMRSPIPVPDQQKAAFFKFVDDNYDTFLKTVFASMGRDSAQGVEIYSKAALVPSANLKTYVRQLLDVDESGAARALTVPTLYVGSSRAWPDTASWASVARSRGWEGATQVKATRIADSGYLIMADQPDSLAAAIKSFAQDVLSRQPMARK
jgi:pimeloyl-ACP methyl ester carboxylesterase